MGWFLSVSLCLCGEIFLLLPRKILLQITFNKLEEPVVGERVSLDQPFAETPRQRRQLFPGGFDDGFPDQGRLGVALACGESEW